MPGGYAPTVIRQTPQPVTGSGSGFGGLVGRIGGAGIGAGNALTRASGGAQMGATQPPIPAGAYNPIRDIELNAGKRGAQNTIEDFGTRESRGAANYLLSEEGVKRQESEQTQDRNTALQALQRSFQRLGVRQGEQANAAGVLRGGALLQSAAKRAANEGIGRTGIETTYNRQQEADQRQLGALALQRQGDQQENATGISRAEREQGQFGIDTETLKAREASENGYRAPTGPAKLLFNQVNAKTGEHFRTYKAGGRTVHEYHNGHKEFF